MSSNDDSNMDLDWGTRPPWAIALLIIEAHIRCCGYGPTYSEIAGWAGRTSRAWASIAVAEATQRGMLERPERRTMRAYEITPKGKAWCAEFPGPEGLERWLVVCAAAQARVN